MITIDEVIKFREYDYELSQKKLGVFVCDREVQGCKLIDVLLSEGFTDNTSKYRFGDSDGDDIVIRVNKKDFVICDKKWTELEYIIRNKRFDKWD